MVKSLKTERLIIIVVLFILTLAVFQLPTYPQVYAENLSQEEILSATQPIKTTSSFQTKIETQTEIIPRKTIEKDDPNLEIGTEQITQAGEDGKRVIVTKTTMRYDEEVSKEVISTETTQPKDKIISKGTKIVYRDLETADAGKITYWKKIRVWATHYDSRCLGCNEWTATGMRAGKGVIAVDPKVIKLRSKVYVPGYGVAIAGDTGGAIKGDIIDLGFEDARTAGWSARFVDIYLL